MPESTQRGNQRLERLVADLSLDKEMLQEVVRKKFGLPRPCKVCGRAVSSQLHKVSGLSRVGCCFGQAIMRFAGVVPK